MGRVTGIDRSIASGTDNSIRGIQRLDDFTQHVRLVHSHAGHDRNAVAHRGDEAQLPTAKHGPYWSERCSSRTIPEPVDGQVPAKIERRKATNETEIGNTKRTPLVAESDSSGAPWTGAQA